MPYQAQRAPRRSVCPAPVPRSSPVRPSSVPRPFPVCPSFARPCPTPYRLYFRSSSVLCPSFVCSSSVLPLSLTLIPPGLIRSLTTHAAQRPAQLPAVSLHICTFRPGAEGVEARSKTMPPPPPPGPSESHRRLNETRQIEIKMEIALLLSGKSLFRAFRSIKKRE